jgi:transcriptional regulator with XRE-family HTH domain
MSAHLRDARKKKGLTQAEVGNAIGRDQSTVSKYEAGSARVDVDVAPAYAEVLGVSIVDVLYPQFAAVEGAA